MGAYADVYNSTHAAPVGAYADVYNRTHAAPVGAYADVYNGTHAAPVGAYTDAREVLHQDDHLMPHVYIYIYIYIYVYTYICMYVCMYVYIYMLGLVSVMACFSLVSTYADVREELRQYDQKVPFFFLKSMCFISLNRHFNRIKEVKERSHAHLPL